MSDWIVKSPPSGPENIHSTKAGINLGPLAEALAKAQAAFPKVVKDKTAKVQLKSGGEYSYRYADLASVFDAVRKPLADNGLAVFQIMSQVDGVTLYLETVLAHSSGQQVVSCYPLTKHDRPQEMGSEITYARRYCLSALLGIASEDDDDGTAAQNAPPKAPEAARSPVVEAPKAEVAPPPPLASLEESLAYFEKGGKQCPSCGQETVRRGKLEYGGGFYCANKAGGCKEKWRTVLTPANPPTTDDDTDDSGRLFLEKAITRLGASHKLTTAETGALMSLYLGGKTIPQARTPDLNKLYLFLNDREAVAQWRAEQAK